MNNSLDLLESDRKKFDEKHQNKKEEKEKNKKDLLKEMNLYNDELNAEIKQLKGKVNELEENHKYLNKSIERLERENEDLIEENSNLADINEDLKRKSEELKRDSRELSLKAESDYIKQIDSLNEGLVKQKSENELLSIILHELKKADDGRGYEEFREKTEKLMQERSYQLDSLKENNAKLANQNKLLLKKIAELDQRALKENMRKNNIVSTYQSKLSAIQSKLSVVAPERVLYSKMVKLC